MTDIEKHLFLLWWERCFELKYGKLQKQLINDLFSTGADFHVLRTRISSDLNQVGKRRPSSVRREIHSNSRRPSSIRIITA